MIIDRTHVGWATFALCSTVVAFVLYICTFYPDFLPVKVTLLQGGPHTPLTSRAGGTPYGLICGSMALLIFVYAAMLGWFRKHPKWRMGTVHVVLKAHVWLTILTIPLVLFHCGFHTGGVMTKLLLWLYALVMLSGFYGLALQQVFPHWMAQALTNEVPFEQIPYLCEKLAEEAQAARKDLGEMIELHEEAGGTTTKISSEMLFRVIDRELIPYLTLRKRIRRARLYKQSTADRLFNMLVQEVPSSLRGPIDRIHDLCDQKRQMDKQTRMHNWLHGWILFHAPISFLLIILTVWHACVAAYVY